MARRRDDERAAILQGPMYSEGKLQFAGTKGKKIPTTNLPRPNREVGP